MSIVFAPKLVKNIIRTKYIFTSLELSLEEQFRARVKIQLKMS